MEFVQELLRPFVNELGEIREELRKPGESPQTVEQEPERAEPRPTTVESQEPVQRPWW